MCVILTPKSQSHNKEKSCPKMLGFTIFKSFLLKLVSLKCIVFVGQEKYQISAIQDKQGQALCFSKNKKLKIK